MNCITNFENLSNLDFDKVLITFQHPKLHNIIENVGNQTQYFLKNMIYTHFSIYVFKMYCNIISKNDVILNGLFRSELEKYPNSACPVPSELKSKEEAPANATAI